MANQEQNFEIAPSAEVGTEILEPNMPSNLDFDQKPQEKELPQLQKQPPLQVQAPQPLPISINIPLKSYTVKGNTIFSLPPQYPIGSIAPLSTATTPIRDYSREQRSEGIMGIWEKVVGYAKRQIQIEQGYIYIFRREKEGLRCTSSWRLVDIFKIFVDMQELQLRLVAKMEGNSQLITRDFQSGQLKNIMARLNEQLNSIGLTLV